MAKLSLQDRWKQDEENPIPVFPRCLSCIHYSGRESCTAYVKIPMEIFENKVIHDKVRDDQVGESIYEINPF